ncbi:hypothetical protein WJX81_005616 [Elliptochloris bilobata]|uniref:S-acyltransferase n=1 Tax=Elliptochloris bilobata TaxID=381761 RepID=A0AAW1SB95_9CHLO
MLASAGPVHDDRGAVQTVLLPLEVILQRARGTIILGIDRSVWLFYLAHTAGPTFLYFCSPLHDRVQGALTLRQGLTGNHAYIAAVIACLAAQTALFVSLYRSDPGWVRPGYGWPGPPSGGACAFCGARPPLRHRHDHNTGQCVAGFDHFCPLLATAIGDLNHARFWWYCVLESVLAGWGALLAWPACRACLFPASAAAADWCRAHPWRTAAQFAVLAALLAALSAFKGLVVMHSYLAASNQTTYELCRGAKVPYLEPYYTGYSPPGVKLRGRPLLCLAARVLRGQGPPAPFSRGLAFNLWVFFLARKPFAHVPAPPTSHLAQP